MRVILVGDVHLSDRPPSIRTDSYADDVLDKLRFVCSLADEQHGADAIVFGGDVFHVKQPNRTSHELVQRAAEVLQTTDVPKLIVPGNHDMQHDRLDSLPRQPLGSLVLADGIDLLVGWHAELPVFGLPYLWDWKADLPAHMAAWEERDPRWSLMVTHAPLFPDDQHPPYEYISAGDWAGLMRSKTEHSNCVYYAHIHDLHGDYPAGPKGLRVTMCNQGALSRGSLHESTLKRKPAVTVWDPDGVPQFRRVEVPHRPAAEVFKLAAKAEEDGRVDRLDEFLAGVEATQLGTVSTELVLDHVRGMDLSEGTRKMIEECLETAAHR